MNIIVFAIAAALTITVAIALTSIAQAKTATKAIEGMARQPEIAGRIQTALIISMAMMEALTIYGLLVALMLISKI